MVITMARNEKFAMSFWDEELSSSVGFDILCKRMKDGRKMVKDVDDYFKQRSKIETNYAKDLAKLVKSMEAREDMHSLGESWNTLKRQTHSMVQSHEETSADFLLLSLDMKRLVETMHIQTKQHEDKVNRLHNHAKNLEQKMLNQKRQYEQKAREYDTTSNESSHMNRHQQLFDPKVISKQKIKESKSKDDMERSDELRRSQGDWEDGKLTACSIFQNLEEGRIASVRDVLWKGTNVISQLCLDDDKYSEAVRKSLELCDVDEDIRVFANKNATGNTRPDYHTYKDFFNP